MTLVSCKKSPDIHGFYDLDKDKCCQICGDTPSNNTANTLSEKDLKIKQLNSYMKYFFENFGSEEELEDYYCSYRECLRTRNVNPDLVFALSQAAEQKK